MKIKLSQPKKLLNNELVDKFARYTELALETITDLKGSMNSKELS